MDDMNKLYSKIKYVDKQVSRIFFGTAIRPMLYGQDCNELLDCMFSAGINAFDTARNYGGAEISLGKWLEHSGKRDAVVILSKCGHPDENGKRVNEKAIREDFAKSCEYLRTNYIDIYLLHRDDEEISAGVAVEIFNAMHAEGKIGAFGGSNWTHKRIEEANEYAYKHNLIPFTVSSPNFGLAHQIQDPWGGGCVTISGKENESARSWYKKNALSIIAYSSLGRGFFSGKFKADDRESAKKMLDAISLKAYDCEENYERLRRCEILAAKKEVSVAQIAMRWIFAQGLDMYSVVSTMNIDRMKENIVAIGTEMTENEAAYLDLRSDSYE